MLLAFAVVLGCRGAPDLAGRWRMSEANLPPAIRGQVTLAIVMVLGHDGRFKLAMTSGRWESGKGSVTLIPDRPSLELEALFFGKFLSQRGQRFTFLRHGESLVVPRASHQLIFLRESD